MKKILSSTFLACSLQALTSHAFTLPAGESNFILGVGQQNQGYKQLIEISNSLGNIYVPHHQNDSVWVVGLSHLFNAYEKGVFRLALGASAYYLGLAQTNGLIYMEQVFPDLSYQYSTQNIPLYAQAKAIWNSTNNKSAFTVDAGVGPNFSKNKDYQEYSIDGGTRLNNSFLNKSTTNWSAMAGVGFRVNDVTKHHAALEVGYKYFYLNKGRFDPSCNCVLTSLDTGNRDVHALTLTIIL